MADEKIIVDIVANVNKLDAGLATAERKIDASTARMARRSNIIGDKIGRDLVKGIVVAFATRGIDDALEKSLAAWTSGARGRELGLTIAESIVDGMRSIPIAGALGGWIAAGLGSAFGSGPQTPAQEAAKRQAEIERKQRIADATSDMLLDLRRDTMSPEERDYSDLKRRRDDLLKMLGNNPAAQRAILPVIDHEIDARIERNRQERLNASQSRPGPTESGIRRYATPFGQFAVAPMGSQALTAGLQMQMAKDAKKTADNTAELVKVLRKSANATGFN